MSAEPIMRSSDYAAAIEDQVKLVRHFRNLQQSKESTANRVAELRQRAQELLASADRIEAESRDAVELEERAIAEIKKLRAGQALLSQQSKLSTIEKLAGQLADLDPDALAAVLAQLEAAKGGA